MGESCCLQPEKHLHILPSFTRHTLKISKTMISYRAILSFVFAVFCVSCLATRAEATAIDCYCTNNDAAEAITKDEYDVCFAATDPARQRCAVIEAPKENSTTELVKCLKNGVAHTPTPKRQVSNTSV